MNKSAYQEAKTSLETITKASYQIREQYFIYIDREIYQFLTRKELALVVQIYHLNQANLVSTNAEYAAFLQTTAKGTNISQMIANINKKVPGLLHVEYNVYVNQNQQIKQNPKDYYRQARAIFITRSLHIKGTNDFVKVPAFALQKASYFLSGNELRLYQFLSSLPETRFNGFLQVISAKLGLSINKIKYALQKLVKCGALNVAMKRIVNKLKNVFYTRSYIHLTKNWKYQFHKLDELKQVKGLNPFRFLTKTKLKIKQAKFSSNHKQINLTNQLTDQDQEPPPGDHDISWDKLMKEFDL